MIDALVIRFDAPLISFGGSAVDNLRVTRTFPGRAMLTGLLANALGWTHGEADRLGTLQERLRYAVRCDREGRRLIDYQTVDLGQDFLDAGWTTRGAVEGREGGPASKGTHIRYRHYLADAVFTVALTLAPPGSAPALDEIAAALHEPARPLFIGRKTCLPSVPLLIGRRDAATLLAALREVEPSPRTAGNRRLTAWWPADEDTGLPNSRLVPITDDRDWANQIHAGRRWIHEGEIDV